MYRSLPLTCYIDTRSGSKLLIGTQSGTLALFSPRHGYADCVTRIPGHPHSIDTLSPIPSRYPNSSSTVLTGSSDGLVRVVEVFPQSRLVGVLTDSAMAAEEGGEGPGGGEGWPVERVRVDLSGEGRWVGCVGHEEVLRMVDMKEVFEDEEEEDSDKEADSDGSEADENDEVHEKAESKKVERAKHASSDDEEEEEEESGEDSEHDPSASKSNTTAAGSTHPPENLHKEEADDEDDAKDPESGAEVEAEADSDSDVQTKERKRKKKREMDPFRALKKSKGRNQLEVGDGFFADL